MELFPAWNWCWGTEIFHQWVMHWSAYVLGDMCANREVECTHMQSSLFPYVSMQPALCSSRIPRAGTSSCLQLCNLYLLLRYYLWQLIKATTMTAIILQPMMSFLSLLLVLRMCVCAACIDELSVDSKKGHFHHSRQVSAHLTFEWSKLKTGLYRN